MAKQNYIGYQSEEISLTGKWETIEKEGEGNIKIETPDLFEEDYTLKKPKATCLQGRIHQKGSDDNNYEDALEDSIIDSDHVEVAEDDRFIVFQPIEEDGETGVYFTD
jgi:hypothetical protein